MGNFGRLDPNLFRHMSVNKPEEGQSKRAHSNPKPAENQSIQSQPVPVKADPYAEWRQLMQSAPIPDPPDAADESSKRLKQALNTLETVAPPDAYWYMDESPGLFD